MKELPKYYFRIRENGAAVFSVDTENRQQRIEMKQIATVNVRNGEIKPHGQHNLSPEDHGAISDWLGQRQEIVSRRQMDEIQRTVDHLNLTAQWAQSRATEAELDAITDDLLMAMHDLRSVLVRKLANRS